MAVLISSIFEGWQGYQRSLVLAIEPLSDDQLGFRSREGFRSFGEVAGHIALGRIDWFSRMGLPEARNLLEEVGKAGIDEVSLGRNRELILAWLDKSWTLVQGILESWTLDDLWRTFRQPYQGKVYDVSHQWVIWRIMAHDIHHGGQITEMLYAQGVEPFELGALGGHLTEPREART